MNCDDVRELLAAYAVDALPKEERAVVRDHLAGCALHPELSDLRATIEALAGLPDELDPPPGLRVRVLAVTAAPRPAPAAVPVRLEPHPRRSVFVPVPWSLAAGVAAVAIALGWWASTREAQAPVLVTREATALAGPSQGRLTYSPTSRQLVVEVESLAPPPPGMTYQLWVVRGSMPESLGTFTPSDAGRGVVTVQTILVEGETVAVTLEPAGGSASPTAEPFLAIRI